MKLSKRSKLSFLAVLLFAGLIACGPLYHTFYNYTPPKNAYGPYCTNMCLNGKSQCENNCQQRQSDCEYRSERAAEREYDDYRREREANNRQVKKTQSSFRRGCYELDECNTSCHQNYNLCYTNCGGIVSQYQKCTAFCDQK